MDKFTWDDLRLILEIGRSGSLKGAAGQLRQDHSTIFRRLTALEKTMGARLFERSKGHYRPTDAGAVAMTSATQIEQRVRDLEVGLFGQDQKLAGPIRLTAPDDLLFDFYLDDLAAFRAAHPAIHLELAADNRLYDLSAREADVALRASDHPPESLVGRRLAVIGTGLYVHHRLLPSGVSHRTQLKLGAWPWIVWQAGGGPARFHTWIKDQAAGAKVTMTCNSMRGIFSACRAGMGLALLPCHLGDPAPELRRLDGGDLELDTDLWVLTHAQLRGSARITALIDCLAKTAKRSQGRLLGRAIKHDKARALR